MDKGAEYYAGYLNGSDECFYGLVREYYDGLTMYINGIVGDFYRAEELADDTLLKLAVKKPPFRGGSTFRTWLYSIGRNVALSSMRRDAQKCVGLDETAEGGARPDEEYLRGEEKKQLYAAMERLRPEYREVLWLTFFEEMEPDAVAAVMHKNRNNIYQLVSRAKEALGKELEKEGFEYDGSR